MMEPISVNKIRQLEPVRGVDGHAAAPRWTRRFVLFLRVMAGLSMLKGLYHWSRVVGIGVGDDLFEHHLIVWQAATVFFAVIDMVAAVGLWLAATWGTVIWLMSVGSMLAVEIFFPQVFNSALLTGLVEGGLLAVYLWLAVKAAPEQAL
jgi:hypothetical protein